MSHSPVPMKLRMQVAGLHLQLNRTNITRGRSSAVDLVLFGPCGAANAELLQRKTILSN